jgi:uncharacterized protein (DUF58 family)
MFFLFVILIIGVAFHFPWLIIFSILVSVVLGISSLWKMFSLNNIIYERSWHFTRGFPGEKTIVKIRVANNKLLPLSWLSTTDLWPQAVSPEDKTVLKPSHISEYGELINVYSLLNRQQVIRNFEVVFKKRGIHSIGPTEIESGDIFGFYKQSNSLENQNTLPYSRIFYPYKTFPFRQKIHLATARLVVTYLRTLTAPWVSDPTSLEMSFVEFIGQPLPELEISR